MSVSDSSEDSPVNWESSLEELDELTNDKEAINQPDNQPTLRRLLSHLSDITNVPTARWFVEPILEEVAKQGGAKCIARIYRHADDIAVLRQAARLGRHLSRHKVNKKIMAEEKRLEDAVHALERHNHKDVVVAQHLLVVLGNLAHSDENKERLKQEGAFNLVARIMTSYPTNRGIQHYGSTFIYNISTFSNRQEEDYCSSFQGNGLISALAHSIQTFPDDQESMPWALHALKFLTERPTLQEECVDGGAIEACILHFKSAPLDTTRTTAQELKHAAESLRYLVSCSSSSCKGKAVDRLMRMDEIVPTLIKTMNCYPLTKPYLTSVLGKVVEEKPGSDEMRQMLDDCKVPLPILTLLRKSTGDRNMVAWGLERLYRMAYNGDHRKEIYLYKGLDTVLSLVQAYRNDENVVETAAGVVWLLCFREDCQGDVKDRGLVTMLDDIRRTYNRNGHIQERANAIFKLAKLTPPE
eukprot:gb/GECG01011115.1/.p1 GENE.gb/GECG01011115.1/~~gb/GECG01011115.1/.p1  ORF type:complete len:469 (+),score=51.23 gb/GECG01011115.1/:1-1407(+)